MDFNTGTFYYLPWIMLLSFPMGALTGFIMYIINKSPIRKSLLKEEGENT